MWFGCFVSFRFVYSHTLVSPLATSKAVSVLARVCPLVCCNGQVLIWPTVGGDRTARTKLPREFLCTTSPIPRGWGGSAEGAPRGSWGLSARKLRVPLKVYLNPHCSHGTAPLPTGAKAPLFHHESLIVRPRCWIRNFWPKVWDPTFISRDPQTIKNKHQKSEGWWQLTQMTEGGRYCLWQTYTSQ